VRKDDFIMTKAAVITSLVLGNTLASGRADEPRIVHENIDRIALEFVSKEGMPVNDLFRLVESQPEFYSKGVHFNGKGISAQAEQVSRSILEVLKLVAANTNKRKLDDVDAD
jgi:hypothetical protein